MTGLLATISPKRRSKSPKSSTEKQRPILGPFHQNSLAPDSQRDAFVQFGGVPEHTVQRRSNEELKCQMASDDKRVSPGKNHSDGPRSTTLSEIIEHESDRFVDQHPNHPTFHDKISRSTALSHEARHSTDSAVLNEPQPIVSPRRRCASTRPLYPDLPSAHAKILGNCYKIDIPQPSSEFDLRFPLACSVSSEEVDDGDNMADRSIQDTSIPLRDLTRREVLSAQGVLHEAEYHQESSAVFETSETPEKTPQDQRESITLDEIVSQYADRSPLRKSPHHRISYHQALRDIEDETHDQAPDFLHSVPTDPPAKSEVQQSTPINDHTREFESEDSNDELQGTPHSSRCGFLTPSKMRFRLTKRDTTEGAHSSDVSGRSPVSPWDPFRRPTSKHRQERQNQHGPLQRMQGGTSAQGKSKEDIAIESPSSPVPRRGKLHTHRAPVPFPRIKYPSSFPDRALTVDKDASSSRPPAGSIVALGASSPIGFSEKTPNSAVPSSSLLPGLSKQPLRVGESSKSGEESVASRSGGGHEIHLQSSLFEDQPSEKAFLALEGLAPMATPSTRGHQHRSIRASWQAKEKGERPSLNHAPEFNIGSTPLMHPPSAGISLHHLWQSESSDDDGAISRVLRDSRLREGTNIAKTLGRLSEIKESDLGIKAARSSLADYSSSVTPLSRRWKTGVGVHGHYHDERRVTIDVCADRVATRDPAETGLTHFVPSHQSRAENSGSYGTLSRVESGEGTLISSNSTSASLLSRIHYQPRSMYRSRESHAEVTCPKFPLTTEQLARKVSTTGRVPFERLELLGNGEWLERGWCLAHRRNEYSHAAMIKRTIQDEQEEAFEGQHQAGRFLLGLGVAMYFVGGFVLIHDMGQQGALSEMAMREVVQEAPNSLQKGIAVHAGASFPVHVIEAEMAQMVERMGMGAAMVVLVACFGVCIWAAIVS